MWRGYTITHQLLREYSYEDIDYMCQMILTLYTIQLADDADYWMAQSHILSMDP